MLESGLLQEADDHFVSLAPLRSLAIPATLQDSLTARLDRLAPVRDIAQIGAVLGREFPYRLIAAVAETPANRLRAALAQLTAAELIFGRGEPPEATYTFKHALVQDAAYDSLLRSRRQALHQRVATVLTESFPDIAETQPELIAHHLAQAGLVEPAIDQMLRAGQRAIARSANAEAIGQIKQALDLLGTLPEGPERAARALSLEATLGQAMIATKGYASAETKDVLLRARTHINDATTPEQKFSVLYGIWACYYVGADVAMQREAAADFLEQAEAHGDTAMLCVAHRILGSTLLTMGEFLIARMHLQRARELYSPEQHAVLRYQFGQDIGGAALCYLSWALWHLGHLDEAREVAREAVAMTEALHHPHSLAYVVCHARGLIDMFRGDATHARDYASTVIEICEEHGFPFWAAGGRILKGWAAIEESRPDEGIELLRAGIAAWRRTGARLWLSLFLAVEAEAHAKAGRESAARSTIDEAMVIAEETGETWAVPEVLRIHAGIVLRLGGDAAAEEAEALLRQALTTARARQARWWELQASRDLALLWSEAGRVTEARDVLAAALARLPRSGKPQPDLMPAETLLKKLTEAAAVLGEDRGTGS